MAAFCPHLAIGTPLWIKKYGSWSWPPRIACNSGQARATSLSCWSFKWVSARSSSQSSSFKRFTHLDVEHEKPFTLAYDALEGRLFFFQHFVVFQSPKCSLQHSSIIMTIHDYSANYYIHIMNTYYSKSSPSAFFVVSPVCTFNPATPNSVTLFFPGHGVGWRFCEGFWTRTPKEA